MNFSNLKIMSVKVKRDDGKPIICLNAIMKNEAHLFRENNSMINTLVDKIDYYIIVDTGSTDDSIELVRNFFKKHNVPGEIHEKPFVDFGTNRTHALRLCQKHTWIDFVFVMDIDDLFVGDVDLHDIFDLKYDCYEIPLRDQHDTDKPIVSGDMDSAGMVYKRMCIFNNHYNWVYQGSVHEYPECTNKKNKQVGKIEDAYILSRRLGDRSKKTDKYLRDAKMFENALKKEPNNQRNLFYCARSWFDYQEYEKAMHYYQKRLDADKPNHFTFFGERFYAALEIGRCLKNMQNGFGRDKIKKSIPNEKIIEAFLYAHTVLPIRVEALYEAAVFCRERKLYEKAYAFAKKGTVIEKPVNDQNGMFFCLAQAYLFGIWDEYAMACYFLGKYEEADKIFTKLFEENRCPEDQKPRVYYFQQETKKKLVYKDCTFIELDFLN